MNEKRNGAGRVLFEFNDIRKNRYARIAKNLSRRFKLQPEGKHIENAEQILQEYSSGNLLLSIEWSDGVGLSIVSSSAETDPLVIDIADYVHKKYRVLRIR